MTHIKGTFQSHGRADIAQPDRPVGLDSFRRWEVWSSSDLSPASSRQKNSKSKYRLHATRNPQRAPGVGTGCQRTADLFLPLEQPLLGMRLLTFLPERPKRTTSFSSSPPFPFRSRDAFEAICHRRLVGLALAEPWLCVCERRFPLAPLFSALQPGLACSCCCSCASASDSCCRIACTAASSSSLSGHVSASCMTGQLQAAKGFQSLQASICAT